MVTTGATGRRAVKAWVAPREADVERVRLQIHEIAGTGLTLSKLSVTASVLGDLVRCRFFVIARSKRRSQFPALCRTRLE